MCFDNDHGDWTASVCEVTKSDSGNATRCGECGYAIAPDEWRKNIHLQENESCRICEDESSDEFDPEADKANCQHDYGEHFDYVRCRGCDTILKAIETHEERAGCPAYARQPLLGELSETLHEHQQADEYVAAALELDPSLANHPILESLTSPEHFTRWQER